MILMYILREIGEFFFFLLHYTYQVDYEKKDIVFVCFKFWSPMEYWACIFVFCFLASVEDLSVTKETEMTETVEISSFGDHIDI